MVLDQGTGAHEAHKAINTNLTQDFKCLIDLKKKNLPNPTCLLNIGSDIVVPELVFQHRFKNARTG